MKNAFIGVDVAFAKKKRLPVSVCWWQDGRRRAAEAAMDDAGISCFTTPTATEFQSIHAKVRFHLERGGEINRLPNANQLWMQVGFRLFEELTSIAPCIEVFPQATARILGAGDVHKFKAGGVGAQLAEAARYTGWPSGRPADTRFKDIGFGPAHDRLDACLSAWVAALPEAERIPFGDPPNDVIWTPRLGMAAYERPIVHEAAGARTARRPKAAISPTEQSRLCPACNVHYFKRWPSGWDAHAAHRCQGLSSDGIEERKREFKSRFGDLFPGA